MSETGTWRVKQERQGGKEKSSKRDKRAERKAIRETSVQREKQ